eukprot:CAMPEP_0184683152 /NCGR_PEP_ID=MMETSP0312-20130426/10057_1 /TAXON_ID=31354 /ORGANISM="Compsopogon coeruleus, Strain SAG 36.94" /LENGTH=340 /DNA_ID=CAMNT_0027135257 /DNA_START=54 /DNA_END=1076 /DNA_ORIENTATION=+
MMPGDGTVGEPESPKSNASSFVDVRDAEFENGTAKYRPPDLLVSVLVCSFYVTVSGAMVFLNKALSYTFGFRTTNSLLMLQMIWQVLVVSLVKSKGRGMQVERIQWVHARRIAPVSLFYCLNSVFALAALRELSVPAYSVLKRLAPIITLALEGVIMGKRPDIGSVLSLVTMSVGTVLLVTSDDTASASGWILGACSNISQALYLVFVKKSGAEKGLSSLTILYYHSILSLPFLGFLMVALGEIQLLISYSEWTDPNFLLTLFACVSMGLLLNYSLFLCTEKTSPTSTLVAGQFKAIVQSILGLFTFESVEVTALFALGLMANVGGGLGYAYSKYKSMHR